MTLVPGASGTVDGTTMAAIRDRADVIAAAFPPAPRAEGRDRALRHRLEASLRFTDLRQHGRGRRRQVQTPPPRASGIAESFPFVMVPSGSPQRWVPLKAAALATLGLFRAVPDRLATGYLDLARRAGDRAALHTVAITGHVELIAPKSAAPTETKRLIRSALPPFSSVTPASSRYRASSSCGKGSGTPGQARGDE